MRLQGMFSSIDRINWSVGTTCMFKSTDEKKSRKTNNWGGGKQQQSFTAFPWYSLQECSRSRMYGRAVRNMCWFGSNSVLVRFASLIKIYLNRFSPFLNRYLRCIFMSLPHLSLI